MCAQKHELLKLRIQCLSNLEHFESLIDDYEANGSDLGIEFCKGQIEFHERCLADCRTDLFQIQSELSDLDNSHNF